MRITKSKRHTMQLFSILLVCVSSLYAAEYTVNPGESIQAAIAAASDGDSVIVMPGTYVENLNLLGKAIALTGTDPNDPTVVEATVIDGNQDGSVITCDSDEGPDTLITGLTITNGLAPAGGGMLNYRSDPTVTDCIFRGNEAYGLGAGMCNYGSGSGSRSGSGSGIRMKVSDCAFIDNVMDIPNANLRGGGMYNGYSQVTVTNCTFDGNRIGNPASRVNSWGGGMCNEFSTVTVVNCIFSNNISANGEGGGLENVSSESIVSGCIFINNQAFSAGGGLFNFDSGGSVTNCAFIGNAAGGMVVDTFRSLDGWGGGVSIFGRRPLFITNCIFTANTAKSAKNSRDPKSQGGGFFDYDNRTNVSDCTFSGNTADYGGAVSGGSIANSILWGNTATVEGPEVYEVESVDFCNVQGGYGGNMDLDPLFADADLRLTAGSPCIDAGSNDLIGADWADLDGDGITDEKVPYDLDGNPRIENDIVDMGAYEFVALVMQVDVDIKPANCPNPVNVKSKGVLPVTILGSEEFDVNTIVPTSVRLAGVGPVRDSLEDVAAPLTDPNECECTTNGPDGFTDLTLKFSTQDIVGTFGEVNTGDILTLPLTGVLNDETPIEGADCIVIVGRHKPINRADINKDGLVNGFDMAIAAENWLESSLIK